MISLCSINAVGVDIAPFSAMPDEAEVLLLPGLPLINLAGENPEPDLWTFEIETPSASVTAMEGDTPAAMIDYVHPGACAWCWGQGVVFVFVGVCVLLLE